MTISDHTLDPDTLDLAAHAAIEANVKAMRIAFGFSRREALERLVAFAENDEESPVYALKPARRPRKRRLEAVGA